LTALAAELDRADDEFQPPRTATEQRLAAAWAHVFGTRVDQISRQDHFFDRGGTSLVAVKLAITLDRVVSVQEITSHPVLESLAALIDSGPTSSRAPGPGGARAQSNS
jgi:hypothetical protein